MNTGKQVNAMVLVLFLLVIATGAYALWDTTRADSAIDDQQEMTAERGATTFALNCRLCHGDRGEGGVAGGRLPSAPALARDDLQGIENGTFNQDALDSAFKFVMNTVTCGRVGTSMPTWGQSQGGTLSEEQIRQLTILITAREGEFWALAQVHADELDAEATGHATVQMPDDVFAAGGTELIVSNASPFSLEQYIRIEDERLRVLPLALEVERGVDGTDAIEHSTGTPIVATQLAGEEDPATGESLAALITAEDTLLPVSGTNQIRIGDTVQLGDERVRVNGFSTGIPATGQTLVKSIGRTPDRILVSGAEGIEVGAIIRMGGELLQVTAVADDGDLEIVLDEAVSLSADRISVDDAAFFLPDYVIRIDDERIRVIDAVDTGQTLRATVGRAETTITVSGSEGLELGMVIRMGRELLQITELHPAVVEVQRGVADEEGNTTQAASHASGTSILKTDVTEDEEPDTDQTLLEAAGPDATTFTVSGTSGIAEGETFQLGGELVTVESIEPARLRVARGVDGTSAASHPARGDIFEGNLLDVERGVAGSRAASHDEGDPLFMTEVDVERGVGSSSLEEHTKRAEIFLGQRLIVERGVFDTQPAEHPNSVLVRNFPTGPDDPEPNLGEACGLALADAPPPPSGPTPTPAVDAQEVTIVAENIAFDTDTITVQADGAVIVRMDNQDDAVPHNFAVYTDDTASEQLTPTSIGEICTGVCENSVQFELPGPGTYYFRCDVHPTTMVGEFIVE
ncbi:MAG: c-type cytochrome [Chloroflexi bacterium]|nr:c-type cytochrome [Chloroflexota bacterium]